MDWHTAEIPAETSLLDTPIQQYRICTKFQVPQFQYPLPKMQIANQQRMYVAEGTEIGYFSTTSFVHCGIRQHKRYSKT